MRKVLTPAALLFMALVRIAVNRCISSREIGGSFDGAVYSTELAYCRGFDNQLDNLVVQGYLSILPVDGTDYDFDQYTVTRKGFQAALKFYPHLNAKTQSTIDLKVLRELAR